MKNVKNYFEFINEDLEWEKDKTGNFYCDSNIKDLGKIREIVNGKLEDCGVTITKCQVIEEDDLADDATYTYVNVSFESTLVTKESELQTILKWLRGIKIEGGKKLFKRVEF